MNDPRTPVTVGGLNAKQSAAIALVAATDAERNPPMMPGLRWLYARADRRIGRTVELPALEWSQLIGFIEVNGCRRIAWELTDMVLATLDPNDPADRVWFRQAIAMAAGRFDRQRYKRAAARNVAATSHGG